MKTSTRTSLTRVDLLALLQASEELTRARSLHDVLTRILELAGKLINSQAGSVLLHDPKRNDLYFAAATGPAAATLATLRVPIDKSKAGKVLLSGEPIVEDNIHAHYAAIDEKANFTTRSMICIPLGNRSEALGVMQMINKANGSEPYTDHDLELLLRFGVQATMSIRNAALFEQMLGSSGLYARPEVRADIVDHMGSTEPFAIAERLTVLAADMRSFSEFCAQAQNPAKIQQLLGDHIAILASTVVHHRGILNKVIGDGIVAFFRGEEGAVNAVRAALDMVDQFDLLRERWKKRVSFGVDFLDLGVGLATDENMILGTIGDELFRDVTVIGAAVNLATILVDAARDGHRVRCDNLTWNSVSGAGVAVATGKDKLQTQKVPGTGRPITYEIYDLARPALPKEAERPVAASDSGKREYDVFISYRREGGSSEARLIQQALQQKELRIFLDVDRMPAGHFDESLLRIIGSVPNFVVVLSAGCFGRDIQSPDDWMRREIAHAVKCGVNIIPVMLPKFQFPNPRELPDDIRDIVRYETVEWSHTYFNSTIDKLYEHLKG
jgi:class 3 adenylate cyclase